MYSVLMLLISGVAVSRLVISRSATILNAYVYALVSYSFSFDPSSWWPLLLSKAALIKGHAGAVSHIVSGFPHHVIMRLNTLRFFLMP